jgi:NAD-dependent SIR2 family protein deacetylase
MTYEELEADIRNDRYYEWLDEQAKCRKCGTVLKEDVGIYDEDRDEYFCNQKCLDNYESDRDEAAYMARFEGEGPVTAGERQVREWRNHQKEQR